MTTPSDLSVRRKADSARIKLLWKLIAYKIKNVRAAENIKKSMELLRRKKVLAKLLEFNAGPAAIAPLFAASEHRARPISTMESVVPKVYNTSSMTWVKNNSPVGTRKTPKIVPAKRTRLNANPYTLDNRRVWTRKDVK